MFLKMIKNTVKNQSGSITIINLQKWLQVYRYKMISAFLTL